MPNILITGGAGFIPSSLADRLLENPENQVVLVDNLLTGLVENVPDHPNCTFIRADVNRYDDLAAVMLSRRFDWVFHYAAVVGVERTLEHPLWVLDDIAGIKNVLELAKNTGVGRFFYASSSEVYGESEHFPQHETNTPLNARLPYAIVKSVGEAYCESYTQTHGLPCTIFRFFNTYGVKQSPDFVVSKFIRAALNNEPITVIGDGQQQRTFCYIDDHLDAIEAACADDQWANETINIGNGEEVSILELAEAVIEVCQSDSKIVFLPARERGDMLRRQPHTGKMDRLLKNRPLLTIRQGLTRLLRERMRIQSKTK